MVTKTRITSPSKIRRKNKWDKSREKWKKDKKYQEKQQERLEELKNKSGYERNIEKGKQNKGIKQVLIKK